MIHFREDFLGKLKSASRLVFFSGAGISAESGIPTFRGEEGLWKKFKPEELANFNSFIRNPQMVWEWYQYRRKIGKESLPNPGHFAIAEMEKYFSDVTVVTQNVDNLHRRAGSKNIYELHGNIEKNFCIACHSRYDFLDFQESVDVPRCKSCGGLIRPDVVWFGEMLPQDVFSEAESKASKCDICFIVGTSGIVYPAAFIPLTAKQNGAYLVEININPTELSSTADYSLYGRSGEILPLILSAVKSKEY